MKRSLFLALLCLLTSRPAPAEIRVLPSEITLSRAGEAQRLLIEGVEGSLWTGDRTSEAEISTSDPKVARVEGGVLRAVGNGEAVLSASVEGQSATATVRVTGADSPFTWSFRNHIQPALFKMGCSTGACHGAASGKNGFRLSLRSFDHEWDHQALTRQAQGRRVSLAEPEESLILLKPTMQVPHEGGERFAQGSEPYNRLIEWIRAGAPPAREEDPRVERIEVLPPSMTLALGKPQQILVRAHYTDGHAEDVTQWVKYGTTEEGVAGVDDFGLVTVKGPGSGAITVWYASKVATVEFTVPRERAVPDEVYARAERRNFVDDLILEKLASLEIAPSGMADDETFIRRAFLDCIGTLPTPKEVFSFVSGKDPDKRSNLVNSLLERPEYVDYWAYKWSDLLLLSSKNLPQAEELNSFYRFIRESVERNKPWDQFAREILTAKGSTLENGAGAFFKMHRDITDLTETTSQAFLGMSITCARCHNHPLEKWTQDDYYGMANLLARVKLKNARMEGITEVSANSFGDVLHPRLGAPVPPRPLDGTAIPLEEPGDRREHLAKWLTAPENPYFTRAVVNRVWRNFMGRGLVEPEDDLRLTNPPSNEKLLAALAKDLAEHGYDIKRLIQVIMNSASYQRSSKPSDPEHPDDRYYSQYIIRRLPAEVLLDSFSQVTGVPTSFSGYPEGARAIQLRDSQVASYFLTAFGRPIRRQTCSCERTEDPSIAQTLHLANGATVNDKLKAENSFVTRMVEEEWSDWIIVEEIFQRALSRSPSEQERAKALEALAESPVEGSDQARREAIEDLAWAAMSSKEFLFNH
ncbi:MAG: hypothetical protein GHCLOJNM_00122 [bacterium]|nr:hypothetical protein [bacterium]